MTETQTGLHKRAGRAADRRRRRCAPPRGDPRRERRRARRGRWSRDPQSRCSTPGERALWAHALARTDAWVLCGPDKASLAPRRPPRLSRPARRARAPARRTSGYRPKAPLQAGLHAALAGPTLAELAQREGGLGHDRRPPRSARGIVDMLRRDLIGPLPPGRRRSRRRPAARAAERAAVRLVPDRLPRPGRRALAAGDAADDLDAEEESETDVGDLFDDGDRARTASRSCRDDADAEAPVTQRRYLPSSDRPHRRCSPDGVDDDRRARDLGRLRHRAAAAAEHARRGLTRRTRRSVEWLRRPREAVVTPAGAGGRARGAQLSFPTVRLPAAPGGGSGAPGARRPYHPAGAGTAAPAGPRAERLPGQPPRADAAAASPT